MIEELHAIAAGRRVGRIRRDTNRDRLSFAYDSSWQSSAESYPVSLSLPLSASQHEHGQIEPYLWGLLPDSEEILKRWGARFHVSARNPFQLLAQVGEDCAGALQIVRPERVEEMLAHPGQGKLDWLSEEQLAERMQWLLQDHSVSRVARDAGQFSLAGAQPKTAFYFDPQAKRWGVPSGGIPTTHILKPATGLYDGFAENEHFCGMLANALGLRAAESAVIHFGDVTAIVVTRFDRVRQGETVSRIHQEDLCQSLARRPQAKYQSEGGPSAVEILALIRAHSSDRVSDERRFLEALLFNWLISGTDAHAKNYSFLLAVHGQVRLAPLYDLSSTLPYSKAIPPRDARLAMKIGNQYQLMRIGAREWRKAASLWQIDYEQIRQRILSLAERTPDAAKDIGRNIQQAGITHNILPRLVETISKRALYCAALVR